MKTKKKRHLTFGAPDEVHSALRRAGWFRKPGAYVVCDGQFGSTGKGLLSSVLGEFESQGRDGPRLSVVTSNAGPNSGHTSFCPADRSKIVLQQLPTSAVTAARLTNRPPLIYLNGGAVLDVDRLSSEAAAMGVRSRILVNPTAAVIEDVDRQAEAKGGPAKIASTGKGVGSAIARKIMREGNVAGNQEALRTQFEIGEYRWREDDVILAEVSQGFSLGVHGQFYPACTSRECTVQQAIADARIPIDFVREVACTYRTFPIRVGNTDEGHSGPVYPDQTEMSWSDFPGVEPEMTTVTKRVRRVFSWSRQQFKESVAVNRPSLVFVNFMQYLKLNRTIDPHDFLSNLYLDYRSVMGRDPKLVLFGYGPDNSSVTTEAD